MSKRIGGSATPSAAGEIPPMLLGELRSIILESRKQVIRSVNTVQVQTYWQMGRHIVEFEQGGESRAAYGTELLPRLAEALSCEFGHGFDERNLRNMRSFYVLFPNWNALRSELSWTHYRLLFRVDSQEARFWYLREAAEQNWSSRVLERQIGTLAYERLLANHGQGRVEALPEAELEQALMDKLQLFLLELGKGFSFVARQQRVSTETQDFYIDLVFYNFLLKCFVLIDLKTGHLTHQDSGSKDQSVVRYSVLRDSEQLFASKYRLVLPSEEELRRELERDRRAIDERIADTKEDR